MLFDTTLEKVFQGYSLLNHPQPCKNIITQRLLTQSQTYLSLKTRSLIELSMVKITYSDIFCVHGTLRFILLVIMYMYCGYMPKERNLIIITRLKYNNEAITDKKKNNNTCLVMYAI